MNSFANSLDKELRLPQIESEVHESTMVLLLKKELELQRREIELLKRERQLDRAETVQEVEQKPSFFTFKDVEESLTKFNGDDGYLLERWISDVDEAAKSYSWPDLQKITYAKRLLGGTAKDSIRTTKPLTTWISLTTFLRQEFTSIHNSTKIHRMMADCKRKPDESLKSYLIALREIGNMANIEDCAIIQYCIDGINDYEPNKAILYGADGMDDFKKKLLCYEEMKRKMPSGSNQSRVSSIGRKDRRYGKGKCYSCGELGHVSKDCKNRDKGPKCYRCNEFGHIAPKCPKTENPKACAASEFEKERVVKDTKKIRISGIEVFAMVDNGSDLNFISEHRYKFLGSPNFDSKTTLFHGIGSGALVTMGRFKTEVEVDDDCFITMFHIVPDNLLPCDIIIGKDLLKQGITILTPESISIRKFIPEFAVMAVEQEDVQININHLVSKGLKNQIRRMVTGYSIKNHTPSSDVNMKIILSDEMPIFQKPRRLAPLELDIVRRQIDEWIEEGIVRPSASDYASPIVLSDKKDGSKRLCVDYRKLNKVVIKDRYPMPLIDDQIDRLQGSKYFTTLDLRNGFFHIPIAEDSIKYTSFVTPFGQYEFLRAPFGLCNSPAVFQRYVNNIFRTLCNEKVVCVYMDDLIIPAKNEEDAVEKLKIVLETCQENGLKLKWSKCQFVVTVVEYLGYEIENGMVKPSQTKQRAISKFPAPQTVKQLQRFLGLTGYFRKFVEGYAKISKPLTDLLRKNIPF